MIMQVMYFYNIQVIWVSKIYQFNMNNEGKNTCPTHRWYHTANYDQESQRIYIYGGTDLNINNSKKENFYFWYIFILSLLIKNVKKIYLHKKYLIQYI